MIDQDTRKAVLKLASKGHKYRPIARMLHIARATVKTIIEQGTDHVPLREGISCADPHRERIIDLHHACQGNLVRVHEELAACGIVLAYSTLTGFCRREGIGVTPKKRTGRYHFDPGEEMQHDTSPHDVIIADRKQRVQCASSVLCFSRMIFAQVYPTFNRFYCKCFLTEALKSFQGVPKRCITDNTSVVVTAGSGKQAIFASEMEAFAERFGFSFEAHAIGDANRSARVEGPFYYIERNFYPGRRFENMADLNQQLQAWCHQKNHRLLREHQTRPIDLYQQERSALSPLPNYIPEVYALHSRIVNLEGNIQLNTNRYSVPDALLGCTVEIRETIDQVRVYHRHQCVATHARQHEGAHALIIDNAHRTQGKRPSRHKGTPILEEERRLRKVHRCFAQLIHAIRQDKRGRPLHKLRKLHRFYLDYPTDILVQAVEQALAYGLTDLDRIEAMTLGRIHTDFFRLPNFTEKEETHG